MRVRTASSVPRWAVVALVAGLLLAACSDPEEPGTVPRTTPSPSSSSASPTPTTPEAQVEAAVRTYYAELTKAAQTQDTTVLKTLALSNCPCAGSARSIEETRAADQTTPDASWTVTRVRVHDVIGDSAGAEVRYEVAAYEVLDAAGETVRQFPAREGHVDLSLVRDGNRWLLSNVFNLAA